MGSSTFARWLYGHVSDDVSEELRAEVVQRESGTQLDTCILLLGE